MIPNKHVITLGTIVSCTIKESRKYFEFVRHLDSWQVMLCIILIIYLHFCTPFIRLTSRVALYFSFNVSISIFSDLVIFVHIGSSRAETGLSAGAAEGWLCRC